MDPALAELVDGPPGDVLEVIAKLSPGRPAPAALELVARFGEIATARVRRGDIRAVWSDPAVRSVKAARLLEFTDAAPLRDATPRASDRRRPDAPETGKGCVVGVVDWGFDLASRAFGDAKGSRVLALWDQRDAKGASEAPYGYGRAFPRARIDAALKTADPYRALGYHPADADVGGGTHGTHVADIAAGNGGHGGPAGIAPGAELVFVHLAAGELGGLANLGDSVRILEALDFIRRTAGARPFVVNMSIGRHAGPHTGLTLVEQGIDALLAEAPGRAVVMSAGNYYEADAHASGRLVPGRVDEVAWRVEGDDPTGNEVELWYGNRDRFLVELVAPGGGATRAALGESKDVLVAGRKAGRLYHRAFDPNTPDHHVDLFLDKGAPGGEWRLRLVPETILDGRWHAWVERDIACRQCQSRFAPGAADRTVTTGSICNGFLAISVGAVDARQTPPRFAPFSSSGPTRDGRQKPDLVAPGVAVLAARSTPRGGRAAAFTRKSGASQAAPHVAGAVALLAEAAGRPLAIQETRALLLGTAEPLGADGLQRLRAGAGVLDVPAALRAARRLRAAPDASLARSKEVAMPARSAARRFRIPESAAAESVTEPGLLAVPPAEAGRLFDRVFLAGGLPAAMGRSFELVAVPGAPAGGVRPGDIVVTRALAQGPHAEVALADAADLAALAEPRADRLVLRVRGWGDQENIGKIAGVAGAVGDVVGAADKLIDFGRKRVFTGNYSLTATSASVLPYPRGAVAPFPVTQKFKLKGKHRMPFTDDQTFAFTVAMECDCFNIYDVQIIKDDKGSSTLVNSEFSIEFTPNANQARGELRAAILFSIRGRWDPSGPGDEFFGGRLVVLADGAMRLRIDAPNGMVWVDGAATRAGNGSCPLPNQAAPNAPPVVPVTPPDDVDPRKGGGKLGVKSGGKKGPKANSIHLLPVDPSLVHVFFTTSDRKLSTLEMSRLRMWYDNLGPSVREQIANGNITVNVTGHASRAGARDMNQALSELRAETAAKAVREVVGPNAKILFHGVGSDHSKSPHDNDQADRRATIRISLPGPR